MVPYKKKQILDNRNPLPHYYMCTVKPVLNDHSQKYQKLIIKTNYRLMQVKSIAECSKFSILQYFQPSLSYHFP